MLIPSHHAGGGGGGHGILQLRGQHAGKAWRHGGGKLGCQELEFLERSQEVFTRDLHRREDGDAGVGIGTCMVHQVMALGVPAVGEFAVRPELHERGRAG